MSLLVSLHRRNPPLHRIFLGIFFLCACAPAVAESRSFSTYEEFSQSAVPGNILWKVLARNGRSKTYTQVFALDGGTVGIANFAVGGLSNLYKYMDTEKYFGRSSTIMIAKYSSRCRPPGRRGNDMGWGCYSKQWWRRGMRQFVKSPESVAVQNRAWNAQMKPAVILAMQHGWTSDRTLAIAIGVANSMGAGGFRNLATKYDWRPERVLRSYADKNAHRQRRRDAINAAFPQR